LALALACLISPLLIVRRVAPRLTFLSTLLWTSVACLVLNAVVPVTLHISGIHIVPVSLAVAHWTLAGVLMTFTVMRSGTRILPPMSPAAGHVLLLWGGLCLLVLPFTHLAGIDTYKWQDLAANIRAQQSVAWLMHPLSLLGFTPRSYPSAQPLLLATVQMLGGLGVDWGYYMVSVVCAGTGILAAYQLGRICFDKADRALCFAFFYTFSPVFVRYTHWATGRGFFLALLPLFLAGVVELPKRRAWVPFVAGALLLPFTHKVGLIAVAVISLVTIPAIILGCLAGIVARRPSRGVQRMRWAVAASIIVVSGCAILVAPSVLAPFPIGSMLGALRLAVTRFGWMLPFSLAGILSSAWMDVVARRRLLPALLVTFPIAFNNEMYGALIHLPLLVLGACAGLFAMEEQWPRLAASARRAAIALTVTGALVIVGYRSAGATPRRVRAAARFLEARDSRGPFRIVAPGDARQQIQGYVSGCPRFSVRAVGPRRARLNPAPPLHGNPRLVLAAWVSYTRHVFSVSGLECDLYGRDPYYYHVVIDGQGRRPSGSAELYNSDNIQVYGPPHVPFRDSL